MPLFLAPMAGVTDGAFRQLCRDMGAGACVTEMVSAKALYYHNRGTAQLMRQPTDTAPLGLQLFGSDPGILAQMAAKVQDDYDFIDLNMGCPMPKIVQNGEGSALLEKPELVRDIVRTMAEALQKPLTVKIRIGVRPEKICGAEIAKIAEEAGAAAVFVHARTRSQLYSGKADWQEIRRIKETLSIPVIGNGDVDSAEAALRLLSGTGCDAVMVGRAARGNPWIFREIRAALAGESVPPRPLRAEMAEVIRRHADAEIAEKGEAVGCRELRKHLAWYTAGLPGGAALRKLASGLSCRQELSLFLQAFLSRGD
ncbi:MAG: tRNA dihydrouridine synthase DusB [Lachnospiraceae bacterium]|nr:tRNA dihydrouridine synthase DusB [Lachnospiraceae bacterium]